MQHYEAQQKAGNEILRTLKEVFGQGKGIKINDLLIDITLKYPVSEKFVKRRLAMHKASNPNIVEEDGELWLRSATEEK